MSNITLTTEQTEFINTALTGANILVDACIGSGKTTALQYLCDVLPDTKSVLYLTYNRLLKIDAKSKIKCKNATVTNYHGFAYSALSALGTKTTAQECIKEFLNIKPEIKHYDVLLIDEYQDINTELSDLLIYIKSTNPDMQIIAVGDMMQKIYDSTTLDAEKFINEFLEKHKCLKFTNCFRLPAQYAEKLGKIWNKEIIGVNDNCKISEMTVEQVTDFLSQQNPSDVLCLGSRSTVLPNILNDLEKNFPEKYNKKTTFASISERNGTLATEPKSDSAIFTTYDSCKGLERNICVICDYTELYWSIRAQKHSQKYAILRNIFCVAASRGKKHIIFVNTGDPLLSDKTISTPFKTIYSKGGFPISQMFDFKAQEDVDKCFSLLSVSPVPTIDTSVISVKNSDELIDLSPCIGIYQEATYFSNYDIDAAIRFCKAISNTPVNIDDLDKKTFDEKILLLTRMETRQERYITQVKPPFVSKQEADRIFNRLSQFLNKNELAQQYCEIFVGNDKKDPFAIGFCDVLKDNIVYELKFVSHVSSTHFLQCAAYMLALNLEKGRLWNTKNNEMFEITIPNRELFLETIYKTVTEQDLPSCDENIAIIDTETNYNDDVMSIGVVIANSKTFDVLDSEYFILRDEYLVGGYFSEQLLTVRKHTKTDRNTAIHSILGTFSKHGISSVFAYNASFDCSRLPELHRYDWFDIMKIAAYRQYNTLLPNTADYCSTGRLKSNYSFEAIYRLASENPDYCETHNAITDAVDELRLMQLLNVDIQTYYKNARIKTNDSKIVKRKEDFRPRAIPKPNIASNVSVNKTTINNTTAPRSPEKNPKTKTEWETKESAECAAEKRRIATEIRAKKRKKAFVVCMSIIMACVAFMIVWSKLIVPRNAYNAAVHLMENGKYNDAIAAFKSMNGYKDSANKITTCQTALKDIDYNAAVALMDDGKYREAITAFESLDDYKDSTSKALECLFFLQKANLCDIKKGDTVKFGAYEQDNNAVNGKEEIEWIVLDVKDTKVLVVSKYALDGQHYNSTYTDVTWENCTLRNWMNNDFLNTAFGVNHQEIILYIAVLADENSNYDTNTGYITNDKIFLLSATEAEKYFTTDESRKCVPTAYAKAQGAWTNDSYETADGTAPCQWWLRSPGNYQYFAAHINYDGSVDRYGHSVYLDRNAVRPAMWINLDA